MRKFIYSAFHSQNNKAVASAAMLLASFFIVGALIGCLLAAYGGDGEALIASAGEYSAVGQPAMFEVMYNTFKYPVIVFFFGFSAFGALLIPITIGVRGFFLSFAVTTFARLYGGSGLAFAFCVFGVQCLFVFPCLMLFAAQGFLTSGMLFSVTRGVGKKISGQMLDSGYFARTFICIAALLLCALMEKLITPGLAAWVADTFLQIV
ncbi:MAG: hypothetical protein LBL09_04400 [Oscillospiraceae bacterium]|jgi:hypothetical protein|nr:hypothetical protein [Oscillospiraceae bacterium]